VRRRLHRVLHERLRGADQIDWPRAVADSSHVLAMGAGESQWAKSRRKRSSGSKHHLITDAGGVGHGHVPIPRGFAESGRPPTSESGPTPRGVEGVQAGSFLR
jgi:hypothetical protein